MSHPEAWTRALEQADRPTRFSLHFARLGLTAECRSLSAGEIGRALALSGEAAARQLLYLSCPSLQQAGEAMAAAGDIPQAAHITQKLPYSDVLQAASLILRHSGGGSGMVQEAAAPAEGAQNGSITPAAPSAPAEATDAPGLDGYALLRQWAAEDRAAAAVPAEEGAEDAFSATLLLRQTWTQESASAPSRESQSAAFSPWGSRSPAAITPEQVAWELCRRLCDAAGNM